MKLVLPEVRKIAVFRALQLGDMICSTPAFRALRNAYPQAEITLLGLPWAKSFVQRYNHIFNDFIHFPGYEGLPEQPYDPEEYRLFQKLMQEQSFDLILQMQGNGSIVNDLVAQMGARHIAGFYLPPNPKPSPYFIEYLDEGMEKTRHLRLMNFLGIDTSDTHLEFPLTAQDKEDFSALQFTCKPKKYVCIHAGSRSVARQWAPVYFGALADFCARKGYTPVLTGTPNEIDISREVSKNIHYPHIDLTGKTSMGCVAMLIKHAAFLIANSTGVAHIADALDTPSIIISMDGQASRWKPENDAIHRLTDWTIHSRFEVVLQNTESLIQSLKTKASSVLRA